MTNIGITGATGMIGKNLIAFLTSSQELRRRYRPVALVRRESRSGEVQARGVETRSVAYHDPGSFDGPIADLQVIVHLAGLTTAYRTSEFYRVNTEGTRNLLEAVRRYGREVRHFLFSSSVAACGPAPSAYEPKDEQAQCSPSSHYGDSKRRAEELIRASGLHWTILRLPMVLGPYDFEGLKLFKLVRSGWVFTFGRGQDFFSYLFAQDLARVAVQMILNPKVYRQVVNVCYDGIVPAVQLYGEMRSAMGVDPAVRLVHLPRWSAFAAGFLAGLVQRLTRRSGYLTLDKAGELTGKYLVMKNDKLKKTLNMDRFVESGALAETAHWFREQGLL
jgi:nucleoside-diphosphate-sugar epimerase